MNYYSLPNVTKVFIHFVFGKAFSAISTFLLLFIIARSLTKEEYGIYVLFQAILNFIGLFTSIGIEEATARYLPELRADNNNKVLYLFILLGIIIRSTIFGIILYIIFLLKNFISEYFNFISITNLFSLYLIVGWFRVNSFFLAKTMEGLMWQKSSQYTLAISSIFKLMLIFYCYYSNIYYIRLDTIIWIELIIEMLCVFSLSLCLIRNYLADPLRHMGDFNWIKLNKKRVLLFSFTGYLNSLTSVFYGYAPNRLVAAKYLSLKILGEYGFAGSIAMYMRRFLPTIVLQGMIRPIFIGRYVKNKNFNDLNDLTNFVFRANFVILLFSISILVVVGQDMINFITDGKYGSTCYIIIAIIGILILESLRSQQELVCITVEKNSILIINNLVLSLSLVISILFIKEIGIWSIIISNALGNLISILYIYFKLKSLKYRLKFDFLLSSKNLIICFLSISIGLLIKIFISNEITVLLMSSFCYIIFIFLWPPFSNNELQIIRKLIPIKNYN